jgi:hypothetical protein
MKQNSAEQPYEAYERLKKELEEVNYTLNTLKSDCNGEFKITYEDYLKTFSFRKSILFNDKTWEAIIEVLESKKKDIENELNNLVNGN